MNRRLATRTTSSLLLASLVVMGSVLIYPAAGAAPGSGTTPPAARSGERDLDRYAAVGFTPVAGDVEGNVRRLSLAIVEASRRGARYVATPELALTGPLTGLSEDAARRLADHIPGTVSDHFSALATRLEVWIALSVLERDSDGGYLQEPGDPGLYLTTLLISDRGRIESIYRKILVRTGAEDGPVERASYRAIVDTVDDHGLRLGVLSGDDIQVGVPRLANRGAETILITAGWTAGDLIDWDELCHELSAEFAVNLVVANRVGAAGEAAHAANAGPDSRIYSHGLDFSPPAPGRPSAVVRSLARRQLPWTMESSLGLPASVPVPAHEPPTPEIAELGRRLFTDTRLSATKDISCASCHKPELAFTNGEPRGIGVYGRHTKRNVPSLVNVAFKPLLRWDGYASMIENFVKYPLSGYTEMNFHYLDKAVQYLRAQPEYAGGFRSAMGVEVIEFEHVSRAIATYLRTLVSGDSPFDRYYYSGERDALTPSARRGLELFEGKADCLRCHLVGEEHALFMDFDYHFLGVGYDPEPGVSEDIGLGGISTNDLGGFFQTPSLRDVARTAPYMHDGSLATLEEVVEFFDRGGDPVPGKEIDLVPLRLSEREKRDLVAFLRSLTGTQRYDASGRRIEPVGGDGALLVATKD